MPEVATRELTFAQAVREALAEEMRRDARVCIFGEDVAEAGTPFKVLSGLVEEFGAGRVIDTPISDDADDGPDGEPGGQGALHVRRDLESADGIADDAGGDAAFGGAAFAVAARLAESCAGIESGVALDAVRREGTFEDGHSR